MIKRQRTIPGIVIREVQRKMQGEGFTPEHPKAASDRSGAASAQRRQVKPDRAETIRAARSIFAQVGAFDEREITAQGRKW